MKRIAFIILTSIIISCNAKPSFESQLILDLCNDNVADSCIVNLPGDTTSTHFVKLGIGEKGIYFISDLPLSDPRMRIYIDNGIRTRYFSDFTFAGQKEDTFLYSLQYNCFPRLSRYEYDLIRDCDLYYYNGTGIWSDWNMTFYPEGDDIEKAESFQYRFSKAIPYMLQ